MLLTSEFLTRGKIFPSNTWKFRNNRTHQTFRSSPFHEMILNIMCWDVETLTSKLALATLLAFTVAVRYAPVTMGRYVARSRFIAHFWEGFLMCQHNLYILLNELCFVWYFHSLEIDVACVVAVFSSLFHDSNWCLSK